MAKVTQRVWDRAGTRTRASQASALPITKSLTRRGGHCNSKGQASNQSMAWRLCLAHQHSQQHWDAARALSHTHLQLQSLTLRRGGPHLPSRGLLHHKMELQRRPGLHRECRPAWQVAIAHIFGSKHMADRVRGFIVFPMTLIQGSRFRGASDQSL